MHDQISKLDHLGAHILGSIKRSLDFAKSLASEGKLQLVFSHPEFLLEKSSKEIQETSEFQRNVQCIVMDDW